MTVRTTCTPPGSSTRLTHGFILREVWGPNHSGDPRYVRVFVASLRRRIEPNPTRPRYLLTEQGVGYRLVDHVDDQL